MSPCHCPKDIIAETGKPVKVEAELGIGSCRPRAGLHPPLPPGSKLRGAAVPAPPPPPPEGGGDTARAAEG